MADRPRNRFVHGVRARRERHLERNRLLRVGFALFGFLVVLAGLAMLLLPGPGLLVVAIGLGILALEFAWAERLLEKTVDKMEDAAGAVRRAGPLQQAAVYGLLAAAGVAVLVAVLVWDVPYLPV